MLKIPVELPFIDLSVVTHNSSKWLDNFFASILNQAYPTHLINILITDNQSTDDTIDLCTLIYTKYSIFFNSFNIFKSANLGFGCGHNNNLSNLKVI